ncbi:GyrI-like domain-containing protein [Paenibacillus tarimensis]|uniref:GyrI-like domain-containing protein n=1 Tax=Paenibacillus tarimensis TaxID=416012 RepID=UPI001F21AB34|nr:GyrI-like domain-containing protein [Paenibacillus tarimensis]MCF2943259.1 GyrI-like domain-containing protein [Paenibacillus tarimensis]
MDNCMLVKKPSLNLVGISYSGPYSTFPDEAIRLQNDFMARKHELNDNVKSAVLFSPYFGNEVFVTYWAALETHHMSSVPSGMVQFTIPEHEYAVVTTTNKRIGEGYEQISAWMNEKGLKKHEFALAIEVFFVDAHLDEETVELWIPVREAEE